MLAVETAAGDFLCTVMPYVKLSATEKLLAVHSVFSYRDEIPEGHNYGLRIYPKFMQLNSFRGVWSCKAGKNNALGRVCDWLAARQKAPRLQP